MKLLLCSFVGDDHLIKINQLTNLAANSNWCVYGWEILFFNDNVTLSVCIWYVLDVNKYTTQLIESWEIFLLSGERQSHSKSSITEEILILNPHKQWWTVCRKMTRILHQAQNAIPLCQLQQKDYQKTQQRKPINNLWWNIKKKYIL